MKEYGSRVSLTALPLSFIMEMLLHVLLRLILINSELPTPNVEMANI